MKRKHLFTYFGLAIVIATSLIIYSCQKEQTGIDKSKNHTEQSLKDAQLEKRIIAFRDKVDLIRENPTLKSGTDPMEVDSAIWYIEATSNLTYGDASFEAEGFIVDSAFIEVPVTNGQLLWADVQVAYDQVIDSLSAHNSAISSNEKQLIVADISLKESDDNTVTLEVTSGFGIDDVSEIGNNHYWYWGWELGTCDGSGYGVGLDAADKIAQLANYTIPVPIGGNAYYTDPQFVDVYPDDYYDNNGNTLLFSDFQDYTLVHQCLSPTDITNYKNNLIYIGAQEKPAGLSLIHYTLFDATMFPLCDDPWPPHNCWIMHHIATIKYAIWHSSGNPPADL